MCDSVYHYVWSESIHFHSINIASQPDERDSDVHNFQLRTYSEMKYGCRPWATVMPFFRTNIVINDSSAVINGPARVTR